MKKLILAMLATSVLAGCATDGKTQSSSPQTASSAPAATTQANNDDLYAAFHHGRVYVFDQGDMYKKFLELGETSYFRSFIGAGPDGKSLVYGLTAEQKSNRAPSVAEQMMAGDLQAADDFYGEVFRHGRYYVFSTWDDFKGFVNLGIDNLRYTDIAAGPNGETVVYVLNAATKGKKPEKTIKQFKAFHGI